MGGSFRRGLNSEVVPFSNTLAVRPSLLYKTIRKKIKKTASYFFVSCLLIGPKGFTTLFKLSPMQQSDHYFLAKILCFGNLIEKFTDIIM